MFVEWLLLPQLHKLVWIEGLPRFYREVCVLCRRTNRIVLVRLFAARDSLSILIKEESIAAATSWERACRGGLRRAVTWDWRVVILFWSRVDDVRKRCAIRWMQWTVLWLLCLSWMDQCVRWMSCDMSQRVRIHLHAITKLDLVGGGRRFPARMSCLLFLPSELLRVLLANPWRHALTIL